MRNTFSAESQDWQHQEWLLPLFPWSKAFHPLFHGAQDCLGLPRKDPAEGIWIQGSIQKIMPFLAHHFFFPFLNPHASAVPLLDTFLCSGSVKLVKVNLPEDNHIKKRKSRKTNTPPSLKAAEREQFPCISVRALNTCWQGHLLHPNFLWSWCCALGMTTLSVFSLLIVHVSLHAQGVLNF